MNAGDVSPSGRVASLTTEGHAGDGATWILMYGLPEGAPIGRLRADEGPFPCATARFLGETLLIQIDACGGVDGRAWLAEVPSGRRIAWVGGEGFFGQHLFEQRVRSDVWAFRDARGTTVVVQDVRHGAILHRIDLTDTLRSGPDDEVVTDPRLGMMLGAPSGELLVVHEGAAIGRVVRVDPEAGRIVATLELPWCDD